MIRECYDELDWQLKCEWLAAGGDWDQYPLLQTTAEVYPSRRVGPPREGPPYRATGKFRS